MTKNSHGALMAQVFEDAASRKQRHDQALRKQTNACLHDELSTQISVTIPQPPQQEWDAAEARRVAD